MNSGGTAVSADTGRLLYALARAVRPRTVAEFGTSYGISTLYLAAAVTDNGAGQVVTTELSVLRLLEPALAPRPWSPRTTARSPAWPRTSATCATRLAGTSRSGSRSRTASS